MLDLEGRPAPHELRRRRDDDDEDTAHDRRRLALRQLFRWRNVALTTAVGLVAGLCVGALSPGDAAVERPLSSLVAAAPSRGRAELVAVGDLWSTAQHPTIDPPTALGDSAGGAAQSYLYAASYDLDDEGGELSYSYAGLVSGAPTVSPAPSRPRRRRPRRRRRTLPPTVLVPPTPAPSAAPTPTYAPTVPGAAAAAAARGGAAACAPACAPRRSQPRTRPGRSVSRAAPRPRRHALVRADAGGRRGGRQARPPRRAARARRARRRRRRGRHARAKPCAAHGRDG